MSALNKKVLVVDDDPVVGKSFNRVLTQKGYVVVTASNGHEALSKLQDGAYDCVFTDIRMPGMDGLELAEKVHERQAWTPVVIVTGFGSQANEERAREAGVTAFLHKPLSPEQIEETARLAMERPQPVIAPAHIAKTIETVHTEVHGRQSNLAKVGVLLAAPLISLAFVLVGPFVGLAALVGMLAKATVKAVAQRRTLTFAKNVTLFMAAPFIGLAYVVVGPFVGMAMLAGVALQPVLQRPLAKKVLRGLRNAALFFAAPFIGLAYIVALPFVGIATLGYMAIKGKTPETEIK